MSSLLYKSSVLTQLPAMGLMPELLDEVIQFVRKLKHIIIIYVESTYQICGCFNVALQQTG